MTETYSTPETSEALLEKELQRIATDLNAIFNDAPSKTAEPEKTRVINIVLTELRLIAKEIEKIVIQIKNHPKVKNFYQYDGGFFSSKKDTIRIEDGLHFLQSFNKTTMRQAFEVGGGIQGILNQIEKMREDLDEAIVQLESLEMDGEFRNPIPRHNI